MHLKQQLIEAYSEENLNFITQQIISLNKNKQTGHLQQLANLVKSYNPNGVKHSSKLYAQLIMLYHPDKQGEILGKIESSSDERSLNEHAHIIPVIDLIKNLPHISSSESFKTPDEFEEEYGWSYANNSPDYFMDDTEDESSNFLFDEEDTFDFIHQQGQQLLEGSFLEAAKRKIYGPMSVNFPVYLLEDIEEIEMAEYDIQVLDGIEYCTYVKFMDLSYNQISDLDKLEYTKHIQELYLQQNSIYSIEPLGFLPDLRIIDLAYNQVKDINVLFSHKCLEFVNLLGNKVPKTQIEALSDLGVVVIA